MLNTSFKPLKDYNELVLKYVYRSKTLGRLVINISLIHSVKASPRYIRKKTPAVAKVE